MATVNGQPYPSYQDNPVTKAFNAFLPGQAATAGVQAGVGGGYGGGGGGSWGDNLPANKTPSPPPSPQTTITDSLTENTNQGGVPTDVTQLETMTNAPDPTALLLSSGAYNNASLSDKLSMATTTAANGNQQLIDSLLKQQQDKIAADKAAAEGEVAGYNKQYQDIIGKTDYSGKQNEIFDKFQLEKKINDLTNIQNEIVAAKSALDQGLIYEGDRPIRQDLISGRQATLAAQGRARIGALQGAASVIQGNIGLVRAYADDTIRALKMDNDRSLNALNTLSTLANNKLVSLDKEEKNLINERIKNLKEGMDQIEKNKDKITNLMIKYPNAVVKGGVSYLDSPQEAMLKMLPTLQKADQLKLALDQAKLNQANLKVSSSGRKSSGGGGGGSSGGGTVPTKANQKDVQELLSFKQRGMTYEEAILAYSDTIPMTFINSVYPQEAAEAKKILSPQQQFEGAAYNDVLQHPDQYTTDFSTGKPTVIKNGAAEAARPSWGKGSKSKTFGFEKHLYNPLSWF